MGYDTKSKKKRRPLFKHLLPAKKTRAEEGEMEVGIINNEVNQIESTTKFSLSVVLDDHYYWLQKDTSKCPACVDQRKLIEVLVNEINELHWKISYWKERLYAMQIVIGQIYMDEYTGIQTIEMFNVIFILIKPSLPNIVYWTAPAKHRVTSFTKILTNV